MTKEEVLGLLEQMGASPKRSLGQNFLISQNVIQKIINKVSRFDADLVVEVGPGLGSLTRELRKLGKDFLLIEMDDMFSNYWREQGLELIQGDALQIDWQKQVLSRPQSHKILVSNLPYQISSSLVIDRSIDRDGFTGMVLMFQKEVAQRIRAPADSADYGFLSVMAQAFWSIETVSEAGPGDFYPPPNVASRVLGFKQKACEIRDRELFLDFVKAAFAQRRKLMLKNLVPFLQKNKVREESLKEAVLAMGFTVTCRAQELSAEQFITLYRQLVEAN